MASDQEMMEIKKKLEEHEKRIRQLETILSGTERRKEAYEGGRPEGGIKTLAAKSDVAKEDIERMLDLEEDSLTLVHIVGEDDGEKTRNGTLLVLLGYKYIFGRREVLAQEIRRNVATNRVSLNNFSRHVKDITPSLIRRKGKPRSPKTTYRLTTLGEAESRVLLKTVCGG